MAMTVTQRRIGWILLFAIATNMLTLALSLSINARLVRASERGDCGTLRALIDVYEDTPPTTPTGVKVEQAYRARYAELGC